MQLLDFGIDRLIRGKYFEYESFAHPAKLHLGLLSYIIQNYTQPGDTLLDPMCGIGSLLIATLSGRNVVLRDVEDRWLDLARLNAERITSSSLFPVGSYGIAKHDARLPWGVQCDHVVFSPPYGLATTPKKHHEDWLKNKIARIEASGEKFDSSWYRIKPGQTKGSVASAMMHYGEDPDQIGAFMGQGYWDVMRNVYTNARAVLSPVGRMVIVVKDHVEDGARVRICDQTVELCESLGFVLVERFAHKIPGGVWTQVHKSRGHLVIEEEDVLVMKVVA